MALSYGDSALHVGQFAVVAMSDRGVLNLLMLGATGAGGAHILIWRDGVSSCKEMRILQLQFPSFHTGSIAAINRRRLLVAGGGRCVRLLLMTTIKECCTVVTLRRLRFDTYTRMYKALNDEVILPFSPTSSCATSPRCIVNPSLP